MPLTTSARSGSASQNASLTVESSRLEASAGDPAGSVRGRGTTGLAGRVSSRSDGLSLPRREMERPLAGICVISLRSAPHHVAGCQRVAGK